MIAVIGGGISGLATAYFLEQKGLNCILLEKSERFGGYLHSIVKEGHLLEMGPNSLLCDDETEAILKEIGLENEIVPASDVSKSRYIIKNGKITQVPSSPPALLFGSFFSLSTKWKVLRELSIKPKTVSDDESVADFFERHFGKEIVENLVRPFIAGIYAGDPDKLSLKNAFPQIAEIEEKHGSVLKGFAKKGKSRKRTVNFREGMEQLAKAFANKIKNKYTGIDNLKIRKVDSKYILTYKEQNQNREIVVDKLIFSTPTTQSSEIFSEMGYENLSQLLKQVLRPDIASVHTIYKKSDFAKPLNGFGALYPPKENRFALGCIWNSCVFEGRTSDDHFMLTSFVGGLNSPEKLNLDNEVIMQKIHVELVDLYNITSSKPLFSSVGKLKSTIPQYGKEITYIRKELDYLKKDNIFVSSNWNNGVSVDSCMKNAKLLADEIVTLS